MSSADNGSGSGLPATWERLERAAQDASVVVASWKRRALEAEDEVARLRRSLDELARDETVAGDAHEAVRRLRAENAALHSRVAQARKRMTALLKRLETLGLDR